MKSLKLDESGDIVFDGGGRLAFVENEKKIIQRINDKLKTINGELFYYEDDYGFEPIVGKVTLEEFTARVQDAIFPDDEIADLDVEEFFFYDGGKIRCHILFYLYDGTELEFSL